MRQFLVDSLCPLFKGANARGSSMRPSKHLQYLPNLPRDEETRKT